MTVQRPVTKIGVIPLVPWLGTRFASVVTVKRPIGAAPIAVRSGLVAGLFGPGEGHDDGYGSRVVRNRQLVNQVSHESSGVSNG